MGPSYALTRGAVIGGFLALALTSAQGCDCSDILTPIGDAGPNPGPACELTDVDQCQGNQTLKQGECRPSGCEVDTDCCPGTRCRLDLNTCWPHQLDGEYACESNADCPDPAQRCVETVIGDRDPLPICIYERCQGDSDCGEGRTCFQTTCVEKAPCGGGCPDGEVCDVLTSKCHPAPEGAVGCAQACDGIRVLADPDVMAGELCCPTVCQCRGLPPLVPRRYGRYSRVALAGAEVVVSAYDAEYGDLVLVHHKTDGTLSFVEYLDGVPAGAPQVADRSGPRGGVAEPGPDVGTHTSIATDATGRVRIAYHDVDNRALKVAIQVPGGYTTYTLDTPSGDGTVGTFTDIAVDPADGTVWVSYLAHNVTGAPGIAGAATGLKVARSLSADPQNVTDWQVTYVDMRPAFDACAGTCGPGQVCVLDGSPTCRNEGTGCSGCAPNEPCAALDEPDAEGNTAACFPPPLPDEPAGLPRGRGLHTALGLTGGQAVVAYYDSIDGDVRLAQVPASGAPTLTVLDGDGQNGHRTGDVGRFPALAVDGTELVVAYTDFARHQLLLWRGLPGQAGATVTVDNGISSAGPGLRFVGAGARLEMAGTEPLVVYQDASTLDLKLAAEGETGLETQVLLTEGAHGFYSDVVVGEGTAYVVSVEARLDDRGQERSRLSVLPRALP